MTSKEHAAMCGYRGTGNSADCDCGLLGNRTAADVCAYWRAVLARHTPERGFTSFVAMDEDVRLVIDAIERQQVETEAPQSDCTGKHGSQVECDIVRDQRRRIDHLERELALRIALEQAMEESIGVEEGQTFEERAEELGVTEVLYENVRAAETPADQSPLTLRDFGYATGNYSCRCFSCERDFAGDKRAIQCERCASEKLARSQVKAKASTEDCPVCDGIDPKCGQPCSTDHKAR